MKTLSPLRYPGGKSRAVETLSELLPTSKELVSPFFGGGSFELFCANNNIKVKGYDIFDPLVCFWQCLLEDPKKLSQEVKKYFPLSKENFYKLQKQKDFKNKIEQAAIFFVLNRSSFSGSTLSGGMSPNHPRFNIRSIEKLENFNIQNFTVENKSFEESIVENSGSLFYLDPPYLIKNMLYGKKGDTHKGFDHIKLKEIITEEKNWIMSYNSSEEIIEIYKDYNYILPKWKYGMSKNKESNEILIFSKNVFEYLKDNKKL